MRLVNIILCAFCLSFIASALFDVSAFGIVENWITEYFNTVMIKGIDPHNDYTYGEMILCLFGSLEFFACYYVIMKNVSLPFHKIAFRTIWNMGIIDAIFCMFTNPHEFHVAKWESLGMALILAIIQIAVLYLFTDYFEKQTS